MIDSIGKLYNIKLIRMNEVTVATGVDEPRVAGHQTAERCVFIPGYLRVLLGERETLRSRPRCAENQDNLERYQADDAATPFSYRHFPLKNARHEVRVRERGGPDRLRGTRRAAGNVRLSLPTSSSPFFLSSGRGGGRHWPGRHHGRWEMH